MPGKYGKFNWVPMYKGVEVVRVECSERDEMYTLIGPDDQIIAKLLRHQYLQLSPLIRSMPHGRYRKASAEASCGPPKRANYTGGARTGRVTYSWANYTIPVSLDPVPPLENAGIRAGEIIAPRAWLVKRDPPTLHSIAMKDAWEPGTPMRGEPSKWSAGVHAFKGLNYATRYVEDAYLWLSMFDNQATIRWPDRKPIDRIFVLGTIKLWGEVIEHERGYRAEYGKVNTLDSMHPADTADLLPALRERYGV